MRTSTTRSNKREIRQEKTLVYPPRLEGKVKNVGIKPKKKPKKKREPPRRPRKPQSYSAELRKAYQLKSKKH